MALLQSRQKIQCFPCMCFFVRFFWNKEVYANNGTNLKMLIQLSSHELTLTVGACNNKDSRLRNPALRSASYSTLASLLPTLTPNLLQFSDNQS